MIAIKMVFAKNQDQIRDISSSYKTVKFYKLGKKYVNIFFIDKLNREVKSSRTGQYYECIIEEDINQNSISFSISEFSPLKWFEIDEASNLDIAQKMFRI